MALGTVNLGYDSRLSEWMERANPMTPAYDAQATLDWRQSMEEALRREEGWLSLAGLFWLAPGENAVGTSPACPIRLPAGAAPDRAGLVHLSGDQARFQAAPGIEATADGEVIRSVVLQPDSAAAPTRVRLGEVTIVLVLRGARLGIRVWHRASPHRRTFPGRRWYPIRAELVRPAVFVRYDPPRPMMVANVLGDTRAEPCPGHVEFDIAGASARLLVTEADDEGLFLLFADATNGEATYPAGRFLHAGPLDGPRVMLDFNRAYNPPCAFTPFATCPLPSPQNRLPMPIEAGEQFDATWGHGPHGP